MSRSGYSDDLDTLDMGRWRGRVASAMRGKRGQQFLRDLLAALDAMPEKCLIAHELVADGEVCAIGSLGVKRGIDMSKLDPEEPDDVAAAFGIATPMAKEIVYMNDEEGRWDESPQDRWKRMRDWVSRQIIVTPEEAGAVECSSQGE
jgi:hypothetical protein